MKLLSMFIFLICLFPSLIMFAKGLTCADCVSSKDSMCAWHDIFKNDCTCCTVRARFLMYTKIFKVIYFINRLSLVKKEFFEGVKKEQVFLKDVYQDPVTIRVFRTIAITFLFLMLISSS